MGDTVAHAARAPEEPEPDTTRHHNVDHHHHPSSSSTTDGAVKQNGKDGRLPPSHNRPQCESRPLDAADEVNQSNTTTTVMEGKRRGREGKKKSRSRAGDTNPSKTKTVGDDSAGSSSSPTQGKHSSEMLKATDNMDNSTKSVEEDSSFSKDGSSENISSIEIDTTTTTSSSVPAGDLSFSGVSANVTNTTTTTTATHAGVGDTDNTSPETETGPDIGTEEMELDNKGSRAPNGSVSLNANNKAQQQQDSICTISTGDNNNAEEEEADGAPQSYNDDYSETSMTESGFVDGCNYSVGSESSENTTTTSSKMPNAEAHPQPPPRQRQQSNKAGSTTKGPNAPTPVTCRNQSAVVAPTSRTSAPRSSADSFGIPRPAALTKASKTMEEEVEFLRQEVRQKSSSVKRLQTSLYEQQTRANLAMVSLRTQLRNKDRAAVQLSAQHEQRMSALLSHLLYLEGQMRQEQRQVLELLHEKDDVIRRQKSAIEDLASKNARFLAALKEVHGYSGGNGIATTPAGSGSPEGGSGQGGVPATSTTPVVLRNKDKGQRVRFGSVKDKLRRHKSSLELHRPASLDTLVEGTLRYGSQENLSRSNHNNTTTTTTASNSISPGRKTGSEGMCSDELKRNRQQERKERCKSLIDYPFRLNDLPEVSSEVERGRDDPLPPSSLLASLASGSRPLTDPLLLLDGSSPRTSSSSSSTSQLLSSGARGSLYSDEDEVLLGSSPQDGAAAKQYGELRAKSSSMPQSLASVSSSPSSSSSSFSHSNQDGGAVAKERPHSLSGVELSLNMEKMTMMPMEKVSMNPSPTSLAPPGGSESNPFKSFKNVFRRRNSKQRSKKRPASLDQQTHAEYHEALKEHFKKYDLN